jgi:uncharacterized protein YjbJ (UPF0337 family)
MKLRSGRRDKAAGGSDTVGGRILEVVGKLTGRRSTGAKGKAARGRGAGRTATGRAMRGRR